MTYVKPWLDAVGKFAVERIPCPHSSLPVNLQAARKGVLHTTEGYWDGALAVFKQHYAPQFLIGPGRIAQLVQVGTIGSALVHRNADAIIQIEVCGFSKQTPWMFDDATAEVVAAFMAVCKAEYGIPLTHYWKDGDFGVYGDNPHRHAGIWDSVAGWYGHGDVPSLPAPERQENHWDPGALMWSKLFARAATVAIAAPAVAPPAAPPHPCAPAPIAGRAIDVAARALQGDIKTFQRIAGLTVDGIYGPLTAKAHAEAISKL